MIKVNKLVEEIRNTNFAVFFDELAREKFNQFQEKFQNYEYDEKSQEDQFLKIDVEHLKAWFQIPTEGIIFGETFGSEREIASGASLRLYLKGVIDIAPADSSGLHREALNILKELEDIESTEQREKLEEDWTRIVHNERDKVVVESVSNYQDEREDVITRNGIYIVVYGNNHDFSEAVIRHNEQNPDNKLGLIKFSIPRKEQK